MIEFLLAQAYPGCFLIDGGGNYINLDLLCNPSPRVEVVQPVAPSPEPPQATEKQFTNDEIFQVTFVTYYCAGVNNGMDKEQSREFAVDEIVERVYLIGNPDQEPMFSQESYNMAVDVITYDLCP